MQHLNRLARLSSLRLPSDLPCTGLCGLQPCMLDLSTVDYYALLQVLPTFMAYQRFYRHVMLAVMPPCCI